MYAFGFPLREDPKLLRGQHEDIHDIKAVVRDTPYMTLEQAQRMTDFILTHGPKNILELGFAHGVSTCYMAGALQEAGGNRITSVDLDSSKDKSPNAEELLDRCNLADMVELIENLAAYVAAYAMASGRQGKRV